MGIKIRPNDVLVSLNEQIYERASIDKAADDFRASCSIKSTEDGLVIKPKDKKDLDVVGHEFCNYVLGVMKNQ